MRISGNEFIVTGGGSRSAGRMGGAFHATRPVGDPGRELRMGDRFDIDRGQERCDAHRC
ncbi:hypothetical protein CBM2592_B40138 [Cupriavidus taiwanensis]|nr:hypothetical protein CBM2592_B40138 [Cupriavidus taiwanensis]